MLKFQVRRPASSSTSSVASSSTPPPPLSSCCSPAFSSSFSSSIQHSSVIHQQRLSQLSSSSSTSSSSSSTTSSAFLASSDQSVDRSIDELEEYILHQTESAAEEEENWGQHTRRITDVDDGVPSARFRRRAPSPSPSLPANLVVCHSQDSSGSSSPSSSFDSSRIPGPFPPSIPPRPSRLATLTKRASDLGTLRVYTAQIKADTDYKTLRVCGQDTTVTVVRLLVLDKLRLSLRDLNLFHLFMEVRTRRADGTEARSILELDRTARPLELQKCHPGGMSRFILGMDSNAILARIFDGEVCPESNYKSVLISRRTSCAEVLQMLRQMCRIGAVDVVKDNAGGHHSNNKQFPFSSVSHFHRHRQQQLGLDAISELRLFVAGPRGAQPKLIPADCALAGLYLSLLPGQRIVLRRVIVPRSGECGGECR